MERVRQRQKDGGSKTDTERCGELDRDRKTERVRQRQKDRKSKTETERQRE